jgi:hypothetical protein
MNKSIAGSFFINNMVLMDVAVVSLLKSADIGSII